MKSIQLANGREIPQIGLGTWKSADEDAYQAVLWALEAGYRHIDTAMIYGNEEAVGKAIKDSGVPREELFITTKLWNSDQGYDSAKAALALSLEKLGLDYVDLYLIHWFKGYESGLETWRAMEEFYHDGRAKAIGVSNHNVHHLMTYIEKASVKPMVNQIETHVQLQNDFLVQFCQDNDIVVEAYAPFMSWKIQDLLADETLGDLAKKYSKTIPQVVLRWLFQRDIVALPKSVNESRIKVNFDVYDFELTDEDMSLIRSLNKGNKLFPEFDNVPF